MLSKVDEIIYILHLGETKSCRTVEPARTKSALLDHIRVQKRCILITGSVNCKILYQHIWVENSWYDLVDLKGYVVFIVDTSKRKLERLQFSTSSSFVKIWGACSGEFKAYFWTFWALYHLLFDLETIGVN